MENILHYLIMSLSIENLIAVALGAAAGIIIGALPGATPTLGVAIFIPLTFGMDPATALIFLGAVYTAAMFGGAITAILINVPGTAAAAATCIEGYKMTQNGRAHEALTEAAIASFYGGLISFIALLFLAPPLAKFAFQFGPQETFLLAIFGLTVIATLSIDNMAKGFIAGAFGLLLASIGLDPVMGMERLTFKSHYLSGGIPLIPVVIGLFAVSQVITMLVENNRAKFDIEQLRKLKNHRPKLKDFFLYPVTYLRSSLTGIIIGIIPGTGGDIASWLAYNQGKMLSKLSDKDKDTGWREGISNTESANSAVTGGSLIPTLTLGIPGNATAAVLLGGLMIHGLTPGYALFTEKAHIVYTFILGLFIANLIMVVMALFGAKYFARVTQIPTNVLAVSIMSLCIVGSFAIRQSVTDLFVMFAFGIIGYLFKKFGYDVTPIILGMILGKISETGLSQALVINDTFLGVMNSMIYRPISIVLILFIIISIVYPFYVTRKKQSKIETNIVI